MIKKNFCYNLHNISYEINLATRFHETTCNSNIAIEVQPFGYFHTSSARYLFNFWNLTTKKNLEPSLFVVFNSITKTFFYTQYVMKKLIILNYPALNLKRQPPPPPFPSWSRVSIVADHLLHNHCLQNTVSSVMSVLYWMMKFE